MNNTDILHNFPFIHHLNVAVIERPLFGYHMEAIITLHSPNIHIPSTKWKGQEICFPGYFPLVFTTIYDELRFYG